MPLTLTDTQKALLADPREVAELALWIIATPNNTYAKKLCSMLGISHGFEPSKRSIGIVSNYLTAPTTETGVLARLINSRLQELRE